MKVLKKANKNNSILKGSVSFHKDSCCGSRAA